MRPIADIIEDLEVRFKDMTTEQKQSTLATLGFNLKTKDSILTLMGSSKKIRQWTKDLKNAGGTTERVAQKQLKSLTNQLTLAKNKIVNTAIALGEQLAPMVIEIAGKISETVKKIQAWIKEHPKLTKGIALTAVKVGALLVVLGPIAMMLPGLVTGFTLLGGAFTAMTGPIGLVAVALAGIVLIVKDLAKGLRDAKQEMVDFSNEAKVFSDAAENFKKLWIAVREDGGETLKQFNDLMKRFGGNWDKIMKQIVHDPKNTALKTLLLDIAYGVRKVDTSAKDLKITLPKGLGAGKKPGEETIEVIKKIVEVLETDLHPALQRLSPITQQAVLAMALGTGLLKEDLMNLSAIFPEELEPSAINTFDVIANAQSVLRERLFEGNEEIKRHWTETFADIANCTYAVIDGLDTAFAQAYENQMIRIDNEEKRTLESIDNKYDATIEANKKTLDAEEEKTKEIFAALEKDYKAKKKYINDNVKDEEERNAMLWDLEETHLADLEQARIEREQAERETADALEAIEEAKNEALRIASEDLEKKRSDARRTAAKQEKAVALLSAIVNTAVGVTKALSTGIPPFNIILAAITAAAGAVQIGLISAKPIPLAEGGIVTQPTRALIGERGPEAVIPLNKLQPALALAGGGFILKQNNYFYGDINNAGDLDEISRRLAEKTRRAIERGRS